MFKLGSELKRRFATGVSILNSVRQSSYIGHLSPNDGAVVSYKRLGRGPASGKGKTSGRGQKGQKARGKVPHWSEGGQTPFYKRFPIIGFKRPHKRIYHELNLERIQQFWDDKRIPLEAGETLTIRVMKQCGLITGNLRDGVKILGNGKESYNVPLNIEASKASDSVIQLVEKLNHKFTAVYHTKLGLRAHVYPEEFLLKKGYVPLQARPTHRRDIEYYSNPEKRGYLLEDKSLLLDHMKAEISIKKSARKTALESQLETASNKHHSEFNETKVISFADL